MPEPEGNGNRQMPDEPQNGAIAEHMEPHGRTCHAIRAPGAKTSVAWPGYGIFREELREGMWPYVGWRSVAVRSSRLA
jgi:hypothetical protein